MDDVSEIAGRLSEAQRDIMLGHLVDIPPHEVDELHEWGLKGADFWHDDTHGRRLVWPITPLGLQVRAHLINTEGER